MQNIYDEAHIYISQDTSPKIQLIKEGECSEKITHLSVLAKEVIKDITTHALVKLVFIGDKELAEECIAAIKSTRIYSRIDREIEIEIKEETE